MQSVKPIAVAHGHWDVRESGPLDAQHTVLLLPGGMCTTVAMAQIIGELAPAAIRVVAATLPGVGRTWHPDDLSVENYAALAGRLAADVGADVVAGHSLGANVALEMAAAGTFDGPVALLSRSFSREDEAKELGTMNSIGRVPGIGLLAWIAMLKVMPRAMKSKLPAESADVFAADLANNDPRFCRPLCATTTGTSTDTGRWWRACASRALRPWSRLATTTRSGSPTRSAADWRHPRTSASSRSPGRRIS